METPSRNLCDHVTRRGVAAVGIAAAAAVLATQVLPAVPGRATPVPLSVRVAGNHLVNALGRTLRLLGVDRSGGEFQCMRSGLVFDGPTDDAAVAAIAAWHADAVRLPLNEDCWLGINGAHRAASGPAYRAAVEKYVQRLEAHRIYVILDLHWSAPGDISATEQWPMPDVDHSLAFWHSVALTFRHDHAVLFDLFNEPNSVSWPCWRSGCEVLHRWRGHLVRYRAAGMQLLVDVVRSAGATNPIMLGGLDFSADDSQWQQWRPHDRVGQLVVSFHTYAFSGCSTAQCWTSTIAPLARHFPVVTGEFGQLKGCTDTYDLRYMSWADGHGISYLGWTWNAQAPSGWKCPPALIRDYAGAPTAYGLGLKEHLAQLAAASAG